MKKIVLILNLLLLVLIGQAQVTFSGYLVDTKNKKVKNVTVKLFEGNNLISTKSWNNKFKYNLQLEKYYTLELIKKGYVNKRIAISTFEGDKGADPFMFVMEMVKTKDKLKNFDNDFPIALIEYKKDEGTFNFNVNYQKSVTKEKLEAEKKNKKTIAITPNVNSF